MINENDSKVRTKRKTKLRRDVKGAILDATAVLLLKRGPSEISVREIALAAKVKHPLIYRHFGSKNALIMAVHSRGLEDVQKLVSKIDRLEGNIRPLFDTFAENRWRQIALARAMIDGVDPHLLQNEFPAMQHLVKLLNKKKSEGETDDRPEPEVIAAVLGGMAMGWALFQPFLLAATGLDDRSPAAIKELAIEIIEDFVQQIC